MAVYYNTTGGGTKTHSTSFPCATYQYATKIVVPAATTVNITEATLSFGCTAFAGVYLIYPTVQVSLYDDNSGEPGSPVVGGTLLSKTYTGTEAETTHTSGVLDIDLSADTTYWVVLAIAQTDLPGCSYTIVVTENTGETTVASDDGLGHAGASGGYSGGWSISDNVADLYFTLSGTTATGPAKPTNPNPSDAATTDPVYDRLLSWSVGNLQNYDSMDVYIGTVSGSLSLIESITPALSYTVAEGSWPQDSVIYWRIDGTQGALTTTGDEWSFDPRPDKATNPTPANAAGSVSTYQSRLYFDKDGFKTQSHNIYFEGDLVDSGNINEYVDIDAYVPLDFGTEYSWRVDSVSINGTTTGDTWTYTTGSFAPVLVSYRLISGGSGSGPYDTPAGVEGTDWEWTGINFIAAIRRIVAAADNTVWYQT